MKRSLFAALASSCLFATVSLAEAPVAAPVPAAGNSPSTTTAPSMTMSTEQLTFTNKLEAGKKTWEPLKATVKAGKVQLTLVNTLADAHGFQIVGLSDPIVVGPKETKTVVITAGKPGVYPIKCQLHPAHVAGQLTVN